MNLTIALDELDRAGLVHDVARDELPVALVVFLYLVARSGRAQLREHDARGVVVHRLRNVGVRDQSQLAQLRV